MTAGVGVAPGRRDRVGPPILTTRRRLAVVAGAAIGWSVWRAGAAHDAVNERGWSSFGRFWAAAADPALGAEFLRLTVDAALVTLAFAVLGTALALAVGTFGGVALSTRVWELGDEATGGRRLAHGAVRLAFVVPRAVHEVLWGLLLVQVLGFDPLVAVLAIGVPFGAVTAKVYAEILDEAEPGPFRGLRASGAGRLQALLYGLLPGAAPDLVSYGFYRLECAVRSAAVLGIIGAGGLGFQLDLSFQSLRYGEIWTLLAALMVLSGVADAWSAALRRRHGTRLPDEAGAIHHADGPARDPAVTASVVALALLVVLSWWWLELDPRGLWDERSRRLVGDLAGSLWPPRLGPGGWPALSEAVVDTVAMSILALAIAVGGGLVLAVAGHRRRHRPPPWRAGAALVRAVLLLCRAVPPPVWAFVAVLVLFPGIWPGAVALGLYNLGVVGRLFGEAFEDLDPRPARALRAAGAGPGQAFWYATMPIAAPRLAAVASYRWEVLVRETVVVGVVGAGGLGRLVQEHLVARDFAAVTTAVSALLALTAAVDATSAAVRRRLR